MPDTPPPLFGSPACDRPTHDGWLCHTCVNTLRRDLDAVPTILEDLQVTISRQDRIGDPDGRGGTEQPLPLRLGPMEARRDLADTLRAWADHVASRRGTTLDSHQPRHLAEWLSMHLGDVRDDPRAGDIADELGYAVIVARRAVDKPLRHVYVGPCDRCGTDLYAHPKAAVVDCPNTPDCDTAYRVAERRDWLLDRVRDQLCTATDISRALPALLGLQLTSATIRGWARHRGLVRHPPIPTSERPHDPVYRVGDVIDMAREMAQTKARRAG